MVNRCSAKCTHTKFTNKYSIVTISYDQIYKYVHHLVHAARLQCRLLMKTTSTQNIEQCAYKISFKWPLECRFLFAVFSFTHKHQQIAEVKHINQRRFHIELRFTAQIGTILVFISVRSTKCEWFHKRNIFQFEIKFGWRENKSVSDHYDAQFISTSSIIGSKLDGVFCIECSVH